MNRRTPKKEVFMRTMQAVPEADLKLLKQYDTPTVCNVVELFDSCSRTAFYMDGRIRACYPKLPPMVGYAATATFRSSAAPPAGNAYAGLGDQVELFAQLPGAPVVVFQDLDSPVLSATFGEVMCTTYKTFGAAGLITSGAARDLEQVEALAFPCFSDGVIPAHGYCHFLQLHVPVHVGGLLVNPGDLLHGDCNGVTKVPNHLASLTAQACPELVKAESVVLDYLKSGKVTPKGFNDARKECKVQIDALALKLKKAAAEL